MKESYKISSFDLKLACMEYYRFNKGYVAVDECNSCDVIVDNGKEIIEVEVKISKYDLLNGEKKKADKHFQYATAANRKLYMIPNRYYFCVPSNLSTLAIEYAKELNPSYGVIEFDYIAFMKMNPHGKFNQHDKFLKVVKRTKLLHTNYNLKFQKAIIKRCSTKVISLMQEKFRSSL